jgi:hypothetical protein
MICVSFYLLDEDKLGHYKELAIFPEDEEIHLKTIEKLWGKLQIVILSMLKTFAKNCSTCLFYRPMMRIKNHKAS